MSNPLSDFDPVPVVPLEYYQAPSNAWTTTLRIVCVICAIFTGVGLALDAAGLWLSFGMFSWYAFALRDLTFFWINVPIFLVRVPLLAGCVLSLRYRPIGWNLVIWCSGALFIGAFVAAALNMFWYISTYSTNSSVLNYNMVVRYITTGWSNFVRAGFLPAFLFYFFCRSEVRNLFRR